MSEHTSCNGCVYIECNRENDAVCHECLEHSHYLPAPYVIREQERKHEDSMDALVNALMLIRETCKEYYDERIGCSNCPLRGDGDEDVCEVGYFNKPSSWKLKCDEKQDNRLFK